MCELYPCYPHTFSWRGAYLSTGITLLVPLSLPGGGGGGGGGVIYHKIISNCFMKTT
jgi:hypothetical protein